MNLKKIIVPLGLLLLLLMVGFLLRDRIKPYLNSYKANLWMHSGFSIPTRYIKANWVNKKIDKIDIKLNKQDLSAFDSIADLVSEGKYRVLPKELMPFVKCKVQYKKKKHKAKCKYTGGFADHFNDSRRSIRIKTTQPLMGMDIFNLYNPIARCGGVAEMYNHKILSEKGNMVLKTGFVRAKINNNPRDLYFVEEGYSAQTIKNNHRSGGVLFKMDNLTPLELKLYDVQALPLAYLGILDTLQQKISGLLSGQLAVEDVFDVQSFAVLFAHVDLVGGTHALNKDNLRYYYDFKSGKIEPLAREFATGFFDGYKKKRLTHTISVIKNNNGFLAPLVASKKFQEMYLREVNEFLEEGFLNKMKQESAAFLEENFLILDAYDPYFVHDFHNDFDLNIKTISQQVRALNWE